MATGTADTPDTEPAPPSGGPLAALRRHPIRTLLALLAIAIVVLILLWDWNWFRRPIEKIVHAKTGRTLHIAGDLDVDLGWVPVITADRITFSNADWARRPLMASTDRLRFAIDLRSLFKRRVVIPSLALTRPVVNLERGKQGGNWVFDKEDDGGNDVQFRNLWVEDGKLEYLDPLRRMDIALQVQNEKAKGDGPPPIVAKGRGHWQGNAFTMSGRAESPLRLKDADTPYRVDIRAAAGRTRAHARGTLLDPLRLRDFDVRFALSGQNLEDLYPLFGIAMPPTPPYSLDGRLTRDRDGRKTSWHYNGFKGRVGDSDLAGDATYVTGGPRRFLKGRFVSHRLDFDDLAGFIGAAPQRGETTNPELAAKAARDAARSRLLPDEPYKLDKLRAMDADVTLRATRINAPSLPLDDMDAHLKLENGVARLEPLNFGVAGGKVRSTIRMDARESPIRTRAQISASGLNLQQLLPRSEVLKDAVGKVGGEVALAGTGNSIAKILGSSNGDIALGMGRGHISNLTMELAGLDVQEALKFLITKDR
ncbi:MAG TPA: AsmA family protein, partial [Lysobacter sp.]